MLARYIRITIYIPFENWAERPFPAPEQIAEHSFVSDLLELMKIHKGVGQLGLYDGVHEIGPGFEGFAPQEGSNPTQGIVNVREQLPAIRFTTYARADLFGTVKEFVDAAAEAHPWEYPVIEIDEISMWQK
ncbi:MAG: hypothetical protein AB7P20_19325 [Rhizobiaceae bacterium]